MSEIEKKYFKLLLKYLEITESESCSLRQVWFIEDIIDLVVDNVSFAGVKIVIDELINFKQSLPYYSDNQEDLSKYEDFFNKDILLKKISAIKNLIYKNLL